MTSHQTFFEKIDDFKEIVSNTTLRFEPGSKWSYSNLGYLLLGFVIQNVTGNYYNYVKDNIFKKTQMNDSDFLFYDEAIENSATAYYFDDNYGIWRSFINKPVTKGTSAGGCYSTVGDLTKFVNALHKNVLISSESVSKATTAKPEVNSPSYGYGFFVDEKKISHTGDGTGVNARLVHYKDGMTIVILSNYTNGVEKVENIYNSLC